MHERVTCEIQDFIGVSVPGDCVVDDAPRYQPREIPMRDDFLVQVPSWEDIFVFDNERVFASRRRQQRTADYFEALERSPVLCAPPTVGTFGGAQSAGSVEGSHEDVPGSVRRARHLFPSPRRRPYRSEPERS